MLIRLGMCKLRRYTCTGGFESNPADFLCVFSGIFLYFSCIGPSVQGLPKNTRLKYASEIRDDNTTTKNKSTSENTPNTKNSAGYQPEEDSRQKMSANETNHALLEEAPKEHLILELKKKALACKRAGETAEALQPNALPNTRPGYNGYNGYNTIQC